MRLVGRHVASSDAVRSLLPHSRPFCPGPRALSSSSSPRHFEPRADANPQAKQIAVLGGGITGLASAYNLARTIPHAQVTLYEGKKRLGGWLDSEIIHTADGDALFEWGPRTLRSDLNGAGRATALLIAQLGILEDVVAIPKNSLAATNRFLYYPDHLVRMPGPYARSDILTNFFRNVYNVLTEPIFNGVFGGLLSEPTVKQRAVHVDDESVGDFVARRFGTPVAENLLSAVFHGIYAGDIYHLSARTLLPYLWYLETRDRDGSSVLPEIGELYFQGKSMVSKRDIDFHNNMISTSDAPPESLDPVLSFLSLASVYTFQKGLGQLALRLEEALCKLDNVTIKTSSTIQSVHFDPSSKRLRLSVGDPNNLSGPEDPEKAYDYAICTLPPTTLFDTFSASTKAKTAEKSHQSFPALQTCKDLEKDYVNVMVVNLYYSNPSLIPERHRGFGYLLPRSVPVEQNPERALGVIFASESSGTRGTSLRAAVPNIPAADVGRARSFMRQQTEDAKHGRMIRQPHLQPPAPPPPVSHDPTPQHNTNPDPTPDELLHRSQHLFHHPGQDTAPGTKLTVMLGGHWWTGWTDADLPTPSAAITMAQNVLARHMHIHDEPLVARARLSHNAIPQYRPGYRRQMATVHHSLIDCFAGRLKLAGPPWQGGVGVNDCVRKARELSLAVREGWDDVTGLEGFVGKEEWCVVDKRTGRATVDGHADGDE